MSLSLSLLTMVDGSRLSNPGDATAFVRSSLASFTIPFSHSSTSSCRRKRVNSTSSAFLLASSSSPSLPPPPPIPPIPPSLAPSPPVTPVPASSPPLSLAAHEMKAKWAIAAFASPLSRHERKSSRTMSSVIGTALPLTTAFYCLFEGGGGRGGY